MIVKRKLEHISCIYAIKCLENGTYYIGQTKNVYRRLREHVRDLRENRSHNPLLQSDYNKYGEDSFDYEILYISNDNLDEKEIEFVNKYREMNSCYNILSGGLIGQHVIEEYRDHFSKRNIEYSISEETKRKHSEDAKLQWKNCDGYAEKMRENAKKQWEDPKFREKVINSHLGKPNLSASKMTKENVLEARERFANGEKLSVMAKEFGVKYDAMYKAVHKITWRNI